MDLQLLRAEWDCEIAHADIIETVDCYTDVVRIVYRAKSLTPYMMAPREACVTRHWHLEKDGTYVVLCQSTEHPQCPRRKGVTRAQIARSGWIIKPSNAKALVPSCAPQSCGASYSVVINMLDMDLQGLFVWLPLTGLARLFQHDLLMRVAGLRDYIAQTSVVEVLQQLPLSSFGKKDYYEQEKSLGSTPETCTADFRNGPTCTDVGRNGTVSDKAFRNNLLTQKDECQDRCPESTSTVGASGGLGNLSKGTWPLRSDSKAFNCWYAPDGSDFRIRGKSYLRDKKKVTAGKPFGELIAVDWFVDYKRIDNIASRPGGTCQRALQVLYVSLGKVYVVLIFLSFECCQGNDAACIWQALHLCGQHPSAWSEAFLYCVLLSSSWTSPQGFGSRKVHRWR